MEIQTPEILAKTTAERWYKQYELNNPRRGHETLADGRTARQIYKTLRALPKDPTPDAVSAVVGNRSWVVVRCVGCGEVPDVGLELGDRTYCWGCLAAALVLFDQKLAELGGL